MSQNKINIALLLGDPSGIGPELVSKLLNEDITNKANIIVIGEKKILDSGNKITGNSQDLIFVDSFDNINFEDGNKFFLDITKGKNHDYKLSECLLPPSFKLVLLNGPKFIAWTFFSFASSRARFKAESSLSPDSFEHSDNL